MKANERGEEYFGLLLEGRETRLTDRPPACRLVLLQEPVADQ